MVRSLRIALAQINSTVGDLRGNREKILQFLHRAERKGAELVVFPEGALTGYPPEDLLLRDSFINASLLQMKIISREIKDCAAVVGTIHKKGGKIFNSAAVLGPSKKFKLYSKQILPNYGVFDEKRYFSPDKNLGLFNFKGVQVGITICEDIWENDDQGHLPNRQPCLAQSKAGAKVLINISASPYYMGRFNERVQLLWKRSRQTHCPIVYVNMVGAQDELIFDGRSMVVEEGGRLAVLGDSFKEDLKIVDMEFGKNLAISGEREDLLKEDEEVYSALVLGTRDYVEKNGFKSVVIGLSGGIDSALTACIAVDAIGRERVYGVTMPSRFSSQGTLRDAEILARNLGIQFRVIPIEKIFGAYLDTLSPVFKGMKANTAEENLQSRIRGALLMALSNKFGHLVLTTGNKSETSVGYSTLYGDTAGGFSVLKDVPKGLCYCLANFINRKSGRSRIPISVIKRAPTAELRANQKDQDTLPPYPTLDRIIKSYVEEDKGYHELMKIGFNKKILARVIRLIDGNEYKRRQSPPGIKITPKSFGRDRRMPITNRFLEWEG